MTLPNAVGCGAGKSGTTSLYYYLAQHPQIFMAPTKEVHYFSRHFDEGTDWYESNFRGSGDARAVGEFSTSYMLTPEVPSRMFDTLPSAKLLFLLRNPVERAYSNYWFSLSIQTQRPDQTFSEAIRAPDGYNKYVESGFYFEQIERFLKYYPLDKLWVMFTEELMANPLREMARCYQFLGVDPSFQPDTSQKFNVTVSPKSGGQKALFNLWQNTKRGVKPRLMWIPPHVRRSFAVVERSAMRMLVVEERQPMDQADASYLKREFAAHNAKLAELLDRTPPWK